MKFKKTVTKALITSDSTVSIAVPRGIIEDSIELMLDKFKNKAVKEFVVRLQVNYLQQKLHKPVRATTRI